MDTTTPIIIHPFCLYLWWFEWIIWRKPYLKEKCSTLIHRTLGSLYWCHPFKQIVFFGTSTMCASRCVWERGRNGIILESICFSKVPTVRRWIRQHFLYFLLQSDRRQEVKLESNPLLYLLMLVDSIAGPTSERRRCHDHTHSICQPAQQLQWQRVRVYKLSNKARGKKTK